MKKKYLFLFFLVLFSCSSSKTDKIIYQKTFDYFNENKIVDTLDILQSTFKIEKSLLDFYKIEKSNFENKIIHAGSNFNWIDINNKWIIDDLDLKFMYSEIEKQKTNKFEYSNNKKKLCENKFS